MIDLTGIENQHEFYTNHYLTAILEQDLKDVFRKWRERDEQEKIRPPYAQLRGLYKEYFTTRSQLEREKKAEDRLALQRELERRLLEVFGYAFEPTLKELDDLSLLPVIGQVKKPNGAPELWVLEALEDDDEQQDPLTLALHACQYPEGEGVPTSLSGVTFDELITRHVFGKSEPPRWVLLIGASQAVLVDRGKWNEKRLLRFDFSEILGRREASTLQATAALLHCDSVCPAEGMSLLDNLDENSHKHAHAVSEDLKYALREAIELLGNEVVYYLREKRKKGVFEGSKDEIDAPQLTLECLRYLYRLLFLFYIEARPELGYAPIKADAYRKGYSLESLRDIELVQLTTEESKNGTYLHDSLELLFRLIYDGFQPREKGMQQLALGVAGKPLHNTFHLTPLRTHLFDPRRTPTLGKVKVRNFVLQRIVELMSLSRPKGRERRGRVSYAQLGINQLGAVYEALLSFNGFFAQTELYEVQQAGEKADELATAYFVPAEDLKDYTQEERVFHGDGTLRKYEKGTFIYRLAGRFRETSASYYTPEVLTQCLVKYALKELLPGKSADEILHLTICEPAMGSAAFLNEAINQISEAYLDAKQREVGRKLLVTAPKPSGSGSGSGSGSEPDPYAQTEDYAVIKQRVKTYLADNCVFGVDLNPVAVELAEVSLWLNTMAPGGFIPWFGNQLACGNSLVGARRQVFAAAWLHGKKAEWLDAVPDRVQVGKPRPAGSVYHFLLGDKGMAVYGEGNEGKPIREMASEELSLIKAWRSEFCAPLSKDEVEALQDLSDAIDGLWDAHVEQQRRIRERTTDPMHLWGQPMPSEMRPPTTTEWKDRVLFQELYSKDVRASSPYRRLKLAMDYWCSLWFWPIEKAGMLPSRGEFLLELSLILRGDVLEVSGRGEAQLPLFSETQAKEEARHLMDEFGFVNVDRLCSTYPRLALVQEVAEQRQRFLHWELEFADLFAQRGGFDLILGNPPWIKIRWDEGSVLGDADPSFVLRQMSAPEAAKRREQTFRKRGNRGGYLQAHEMSAGLQAFLTGHQNYPALSGSQPNLYKGFMSLLWGSLSERGAGGLLHPEGAYDDPKGGPLRTVLYQRLRRHYQFANETGLFGDVHHMTKFSINVYGPARTAQFQHIANLFTPSTVDASVTHDGSGPVPGIKDDENAWSVKGHRDRIIEVDEDGLELFAKLYDEPGTPPGEARLPALHSRQLLSAVSRFAKAGKTLADVDSFRSTFHWDETRSQRNGTIKRETRFPKGPEQLVLSGPHFFVGNPLYKTPRRSCTQNSHYDVIDLTEIPDDYLPRTNYVPACKLDEYRRREPRVPWSDEPVSAFPRVAVNNMLSQAGERTFQPAILPAHAAHINTVNSYVFRNSADMVLTVATWVSLPVDFLVKTTGAGHLQPNMARRLPVGPVTSVLQQPLCVRILLLSCLTTHFADLWESQFQSVYAQDSWGLRDARVMDAVFSGLQSNWRRELPLRTDYARRQALVEIDVLVAMGLGMTLEELQTIYRVQFPVMRAYESDTWYDREGRIIFTASKGLPGVGLPRTSRDGPGWEDVRSMQHGTVELTVMDDTLPGGPRKKTIVYHAPFDRCDREHDYEVVWKEFEKRYGKILPKK
jgi:hypothetical protein